MVSSWEQVETEQTWCYVRAGVASVTAFVLFVVGSVALCTVRCRHDPSRLAFAWLKAAFAFEIPGLVLMAASDFALSQTEFLAYQNGDTSGLDPEDPNDIARRNTIMLAYNVYSRTGSAGTLLRRIAQVVLMTSFVELGNGLLFALTRERRTSQKVLRWLTISFGLVLIILAATHTGLSNTTMRDQWYAVFGFYSRSSSTIGSSASDISEIESLISQGSSYRRLDGAYNVLNFVPAIGILIYSSVVMHRYARVEPSRVCAVNLLLAALSNFTRWTWLLIVSALWILPDDGPAVSSTMGVTYGANAFLDIVLFAVILVILFSIGVRKKKGIWTDIQPWMGGVAPAMVVRPYGHEVYGQPPQQQVAYYPAVYPQQPSAINQQQMSSGWQHLGQQQQQAQYVCIPPQELGGVARYEASPEGVITELGSSKQNESAHKETS